MPASDRDTIAAIATAPGTGAIGIVRVSGPAAASIAAAILGRSLEPRLATVAGFRAADGEIIDQGLALWFPGPRSFTGEDLLELQGHGGPRVLDLLLQRVLSIGARQAAPGELTRRAYLNGKLDLAQAEAVADLINSATATQARLASRTLQGVFSRRVRTLDEGLMRLRALTEAALDFPDDEIDVLSDAKGQLSGLLRQVEALLASAHQGELVRDGLLVVIAGAPNVGKSSLLNALAGTDAAIVTEIPGTTRDLLRAEIQIDGLTVRLVDTAGLRPSNDPVESEGIRRARAQIATADGVLLVEDAAADHRDGDAPDLPALGVFDAPVTLVRNKVDLTDLAAGARTGADGTVQILCSARTGAGLDALRAHLKTLAGYSGAERCEFSARRRHLDALQRCIEHLNAASQALASGVAAELVAEDLRLAHLALGEITGEVSSEDLLGRIFSEFCIGK